MMDLQVRRSVRQFQDALVKGMIWVKTQFTAKPLPNGTGALSTLRSEMDLKEFVTETIVQIQEGVEGAIRRRPRTYVNDGVVSPVWGEMHADGSSQRQLVEFDVAVTVSGKSGQEGKAALKIFSAEIGAGGSKNSEQTTVSRIRFSIPIIPPNIHISEDGLT